MRDVLNTMVNAVADQAIALGAVDDRVTALKRTLARKFPDIAEDLKGQIQAEQEHSREHLYELQVTLAKVREAITRLAEPEAKVEKTRRVLNAPERVTGKRTRSR